MDGRRFRAQRRTNAALTVAILAALLAIMAILGWLVAGWTGLVWTALLGPVALGLQHTAGSAFLQRRLGADPIPAWAAPDLHRITRELADRAGLARAPRLHYLPVAYVQALATGDRHDAAVGLSDGLLRLLQRRELAAVIAHEIWHIRQGDLAVMRVAAAAAQTTQALCCAALLTCGAWLPVLVGDAVEIAWPILAVLAIAPAVSTLLWLALSRTREFDADAGAAALTGDPDALAAALRHLDSVAGRHWETLSRGVPGALSRWLSTHPRVDERIARLRELAPERRRLMTIRWWPSSTSRYRTPILPDILFGDLP